MERVHRQVQRHGASWICKSCRSQLINRRFRTRNFTSGRNHAAIATDNSRSKVPESPVRTRFAPSPTGNLHLGSIRTALFNYLLARRTNGQFLLRIEDTDQKRTVPGAEERLYKDLRWAGLHWDEGPRVGGPHGPYRQSERLEIYGQHIEDLLHTQKAYRCFCSTERIDQLNRRRHEKGLALGYDRKCAEIPPEVAQRRAQSGEAHVVRFRAPEQYPKYKDLVYGNTGHGQGRFKQRFLDEPVFDDPVLLKSDGFPTYHFANVVDDKLMEISHIIRGSEWMSSTPLHIALYEAFGWQPPQFGHVPLLVDQNKQKLSKRNLDSDISTFRDQLGIFPDVLDNFAVLLGWSHSQSSDVMTLTQLEAIFNLRITKGNAMVNMQKLEFLQEKHARRIIQEGGERMEQMIRDISVQILDQHGAERVARFVGDRALRDVIVRFLQIEKLPYQNPKQYSEQLRIFFSPEASPPRQSLDHIVPETHLLADIGTAIRTLLCIPEDQWTIDALREHLAAIDLASAPSLQGASQQELKKAKSRLYGLLRWAILNGAAGPDMPNVMYVLGRGLCEQRLHEASLAIKENQLSRSKPEILLPTSKTANGQSWQAHAMPLRQ